MSKSEVIQALSEKSKISPKLASIIVETMVGMMKMQFMDAGRIEIRGSVSIEMREYGGYKVWNPKMDEKSASSRSGRLSSSAGRN